ncbi:MAG: glycosyltransferase family 4 protein [Candidatus Krumholzibacteriota bacterium]|nr:glycosyltransferase family 4 protein [Candidatus Krumholzibacteriota bacterium]
MVKLLQLCAVDYTAYHLLRPIGLAFRRAGYQVTYCCSPGEGLDKLKGEGFSVVPLPIARSFNIFSHLLSLLRLIRLIRRERFQVVHAHTPVAGLIGRTAARIAGVPLIVYTAHGFYFHGGMKGPVRKIFFTLEKLGGWMSDLIFVQSGEDWREALNEGLAPPEKLIHIGNGVDPALFGRKRYMDEVAALRKEFDLRDGPAVGFIGRMVREKGVLEFARAAVSLGHVFPEVKFFLIGATLASDRDGCQEEINRLARENGMEDRLILTGHRNDVPAFLSLLDLFVIPSHREGMPRSVLEAMAAELPVVATDIRGCREEVVDGETGILVPVGDYRALGEAIRELLTDRDRADRMGEAGRARVLECFDEEKMLDRQVTLVGERLRL